MAITNSVETQYRVAECAAITCYCVSTASLIAGAVIFATTSNACNNALSCNSQLLDAGKYTMITGIVLTVLSCGPCCFFLGTRAMASAFSGLLNDT